MKSKKIGNFSLEMLSIQNLKAWIASYNRRILIQNGIIAGLFAVFFFFLFLPILFHNKKAVSETRALEFKINSASAKIARIPEMKRDKQLFGARIAQMRNQFFESEELDELIKIISTIANESGVQISASRPSNLELEMPGQFIQLYLPVSYELIVEGAYHNLGAFVNKLEEYSKHFAIHDLKITGTDKASSAPQCALVLTAFLKRESAIPMMEMEPK